MKWDLDGLERDIREGRGGEKMGRLFRWGCCGGRGAVDVKIWYVWLLGS